MAVAPGTRLGPYEVVAPIGAGGMGEVYRAVDTRLSRTVAVKVLATSLSSSAEVRARFEREARAVSALNHPHICTLYDVGQQDGVDYLVMEYLEGETLAELLQRGPLDVGRALRHAIEIANALGRAHRSGIVHRDLKPGNVILTKSGAKLLDFGLARATGPGATFGEMSHSPTMSRPLTAEGSIVGTFQYMSPEQLEGREADPRSDIFSFGALVYEMTTGKKAFVGRSQASLIAAILKENPRPIAELRPQAPPALDRLVRQCLAKDPEDRWQTAGDLERELRWIAESGPPAGSPGGVSPMTRPPTRRRERLLRATSAALVLTAAVLAVALGRSRAARGPAPVMRFAIPQTDAVPWRPWNSMALSPDGRHIVFYSSGADGVGRLVLRSVDSLDMRPLTGTDTGNPSFPFWSPDSRSVGFFAGGKLKRLDIAGGPPLTVCDAADGRGGSWGRDGTILFSPASGAGLMRVVSSGGEPTAVTHPDLTREPGGHQWPSFLPDGRHFTYLAVGAGRDAAWIWTAALGSTDARRLIGADSGASYAAPGYLLFLRGGALLAQPFDPDRLETTGDPMPVVEEVSRNTDTLYAAFTVSETGMLAYKNGADLERQVGLFDRDGRPLGRFGPLGDIGDPALSLDGTRLAIDRAEPNSVTYDIWVIDLTRGTGSRRTFEAGSERMPAWSSDGRRIFYAVGPEGGNGIDAKASDGASAGELLAKLDRPVTSLDASRDGKYLAYATNTPTSTNDIWVLPLGGDRTPRPYLQTQFNESHARISPDSRWLAYDSDESGRSEVYVQTFPHPGGKWQISNNGGAQPVWRQDGRELFYMELDGTLKSVTIDTHGSTIDAGLPETVFKIEMSRLSSIVRYAAMPDGKRFLLAAPVGPVGSAAAITVVLNWSSGLIAR